MYEEYDSCDFFFFFLSSDFLGACAGAGPSKTFGRERFFRRPAVSAARASAGRRPPQARGRARGAARPRRRLKTRRCLVSSSREGRVALGARLRALLARSLGHLVVLRCFGVLSVDFGLDGTS